MSILEIIKSRRTVKPDTYTDQVIEKCVIEELLEAAHWAPNHGRTEPWQFIVYSGKAKEEFPVMVERVWRQDRDESQMAKIDKWYRYAAGASHIIAVIMKRTPNLDKIPLEEELTACACAAQNILLEAEARGLVSYWSTGISHCPSAKKEFELEADDRILGFLHLGYSDEEKKEGCRRSSVSEKIIWRD